MSSNKNDTFPYDEYRCCIEHYIKDNYSICHEERQYAVFLYNILQKYGYLENRNDDILDIVTACGIPKNATVEHVFYEVTFMRDFFERNRRIAWRNEKNIEEILLNKTVSPPSLKVASEESFNKKLIQY